MEAAAGTLFLVIGAAALWIGRAYPMGTAVNMGPGYMPRLIAWGLVLLGAAGIARGVIVGGWRPPQAMLRPLAVITVAILVFAQEMVPHRVGLVSGLFFGFAFGVAGLGAALLGALADVTSITFVYRVCAFLPALGLLALRLPRVAHIKT